MSYVFPVQGYRGPVNLHHGTHIGASDLFAAQGTPVVAMRGGRVDGAGHNSVGGNFVLLTGDDDLTYYYAHGDQFPAVGAASFIATGTFLFGVGDTGNAQGTGPHLHIGIGHGIQNGVGAAGGAGIDFNAVALLRQTLDGSVPGPVDGNPYRISGTDGAGLNVRAEPSAAAAILTALPEGTIVQALDRAWRKIREPGGTVGWGADQFLTPA